MTAPIDLSDLPGFTRPGDNRVHVTAFLGRTSTKDNQDPRTSIPGQASVCAARLTDSSEFDQYFWDVESGYTQLQDRSQHDDDYYAELGVPLRRDGGINDLLAAVEAGTITRVICERSDRAARDMLAILTVETFLERHHVELVYATEPPKQRPGALSASELHMRRGSQIHAEIFRAQMLESSGRGQREHAAQGYSHGAAPYPYISVIDPDAPVPDDRFLRRAKRRLAKHPDARRWAAVELMAQWRLREEADYRDIRDRLNADLDLYPYDRPGGQWSVQRIRKLLLNPRLTGYAVFNRRCNRAGWAPNPISEWTWSRQIAHPAVFTVGAWARMMRMDAAERLAGDPLGQLRYAAEQRGTALDLVRSDGLHAVYTIGGREVTLPAADPPQAAVDAVLTWLEAA
ncbi:recombinase family protein [Glycomyces sp. MUSA5-2]|uniref:recombinase family protein n=1 Tax=Glycomyces sp. MUSA5-2 TaxID=2053002 RepID=UPI00300910D7